MEDLQLSAFLACQQGVSAEGRVPPLLIARDDTEAVRRQLSNITPQIEACDMTEPHAERYWAAAMDSRVKKEAADSARRRRDLQLAFAMHGTPGLLKLHDALEISRRLSLYQSFSTEKTR